MKDYNQQSLFDNTKEDLHAIDNINGDQYFSTKK